MLNNVPTKAPELLQLASYSGTAMNEYGNYVRFKLAQPITIANNMHAYISMNALQFQNVFYNLPERSNTLKYRLSSDFYGTSNELTIPAGNYGVTELLAALNVATLDDGINWTYSQITFKISIASATWGMQIENGSINDILGITPTGTGEVSIIASRAIALSGEPYVNVLVPNLGINSNGVLGTLNESSLGSVMVAVQAGFTVNFVPAQPQAFKLSTSIVTDIEVRLANHRGLDLDMLGSEWSLQIAINYVYRPAIQLTAVEMDDLQRAAAAKQQADMQAPANA